MFSLRTLLEVILAIGFMGLSVAVIVEVSDLPPGLIDPLGSAPVPRWTASILFLLSLAMLLKLFRRSSPTTPEDETASLEDKVVERPMAGIGVAVLTAVYVLVLSSRLVGFSVLTSVFVFVLVLLLSENRRQALWIGILIALPVGFGCEYLFTKIFVVDLPTWW